MLFQLLSSSNKSVNGIKVDWMKFEFVVTLCTHCICNTTHLYSFIKAKLIKIKLKSISLVLINACYYFMECGVCSLLL